MPRKNVAGHRLQVLIAARRVVSARGGCPEPREHFRNEDFFEHGPDARPGERRRKLRLANCRRQLPEQSPPAVETTFRGRPILFVGAVRHAPRPLHDHGRVNGDEGGKFGQFAGVHESWGRHACLP